MNKKQFIYIIYTRIFIIAKIMVEKKLIKNFMKNILIARPYKQTRTIHIKIPIYLGVNPAIISESFGITYCSISRPLPNLAIHTHWMSIDHWPQSCSEFQLFLFVSYLWFLWFFLWAHFKFSSTIVTCVEQVLTFHYSRMPLD